MVCQILMAIGDGVNDLDGSGGSFELYLSFGSRPVQPSPQKITFSTDAACSVFTEQFPLPVGESVTAKIKSPNAADTSVYIHCCIYEVGVESIRDDIAALMVRLGQTTNVYSNTGGSSASGVYSSSGGTGEGVYSGRCSRK